jgi:selenocysteine lyase/cysteine desulfurase
MDRIYAEAARSPNIAYAIARLDEAVQLLYDEGTTPAHEQREQLLDDMAKVVLALQFAMRHTPDGHEAFQRILALVPPEIRGVEPPIPPVDELDPIEEGHDA